MIMLVNYHFMTKPPYKVRRKNPSPKSQFAFSCYLMANKSSFTLKQWLDIKCWKKTNTSKSVILVLSFSSSWKRNKSLPKRDLLKFISTNQTWLLTSHTPEPCLYVGQISLYYTIVVRKTIHQNREMQRKLLICQ